MAQIGRRILYDDATGLIIMEMGELSGDVPERPVIQGVVKILDLPYGQDLDKFRRRLFYHIDLPTKTVVFDELRPQEVTYADLENQLLMAMGVI